MATALNSFQQHYKDIHDKRKLHWNYSLATVTLKARFATGPKELSVSFYQAIVLLLFNDDDNLQYSYIKQALNLCWCSPLTMLPGTYDL